MSTIPLPVERRNGKFSFSVSKEWAQLVQRVERGEFRLRAPAANKYGLGWFRGRGTCLVPLLHEDDIWIDSRCQPQDGDIVIVELGEQTLAKIMENWQRNPETYARNVAIYGENPGRIATKWLRVIGNDYWLVTNSSMFPLEPHPLAPDGSRVLGVVRYVERDGAPIYGSGTPHIAHCIVPNAATDVYQIDDDGPLDFTCADLDNTDRGWLLYVEVPVEETTEVFEVTASFGVDLAAGQVIDYQPLRPDDSHEWDTATRRWRKRAAVAIAEANAERARRRIAALELAQIRPTRELLLDPNNAEAKRRLAEIDVEIAGMRMELPMSLGQ